MTTVTVRHNFETAHRLPDLGGKCRNLHGHSWWAEITLTGRKRPDGTVLDFGVMKSELRGWIDRELDHGVMLGDADPLVPHLIEAGCKVFAFGAPVHGRTLAEQLASDMRWPTVENVALLLARVATALLVPTIPGVSVARVRVQETSVNAAEYLP